MTTKDTVAAWLLVIWILVTGSKPFFEFQQALRVGSPATTIFWDAFVALFVAASGIFLIRRFFLTVDELEHYKRLEDSRQQEVEREARERRAKAKSEEKDED